MLAKNKIVRFVLGACLAASCLSLGSGLMQPAQANAAEFVRVGPIWHRPIVRVVGPVVTAAPLAPVVTVGPVFAHPIYHPYAFHYGYHVGYHFWRR